MWIYIEPGLKAPRHIISIIKKYKAGEMPSHQRHDFLQTKIVKFKTLYLHLVYTAVDYSNLAIGMSRNLCSFFYTWKNSYDFYGSNASEKKWLKIIIEKSQCRKYEIVTYTKGKSAENAWLRH